MNRKQLLEEMARELNTRRKRTLTDEERAEANKARCKRYRERHKGNLPYSTVAVCLTHEEAELLGTVAKHLRISKSELIRRMIYKFIRE